MAAQPASRIVFDLDGTLVQTRIASWEVFRAVQAEFGLGIDSIEEYFAHFERNFFTSLRAHCPDEKTADAVIARFFARLEKDYRPVLVPGMADVIHQLAGRATLAVLSSNATSVIRRVLDDNGLQYCFAHVFGGDVEPDKGAGLLRFLADAAQGVGRRCAPEFDEGGIDVAATGADTVLITDTVGDTEAAIAVGVRVMGVSWGMHSAKRLRAAGAEFVAVWPQEIIAHLLPETHAAPFACSAPTLDGPSAAPGTGVPGTTLVADTAPDYRSLPVARSHAEIRRARRLGPSSRRAPLAPLEGGGSCGCSVAANEHTGSDVASGPTRPRGEELAAAMRTIVGVA